ncbi:MAG: cytochrome c3 family protein [Planctomycetes bacterium]|nr:cytochrome c3 family protein [Planctomycetota bacterium]
MRETRARAQVGDRPAGVGRLVATAVAAGWLLFGSTSPAVAQQAPRHGESSCADCHTCESPTAEEPCLRACLRARTRESTDRLREQPGPDIVVLDELEDLYLPVPFDHKGHADMAAITRGCELCHHHTPEEAQRSACKACHEVEPARQDIHKPGLRGAYHRQCLSCHREWSDASACEACHAPKANQGEASATPTAGDIIGRMHPPIPEPDEETYNTPHKDAPGNKAFFPHRVHAHSFGLRCAECHQEDNCSRCHVEEGKRTPRERRAQGSHEQCRSCHDVEAPDKCVRCHWNEGESKPAPFDHASTGWPLDEYHQGKGCRVCHSAVPFVKLERGCSQCHEALLPENFHQAAADSAELNCGECHQIEPKAHVHEPLAQGQCTACHQPAQEGDQACLLSPEGKERCFACHDDVREELAAAGSRHKPLDEGCATCHEGHSSDHEHLLRVAVEESCFECHAEVKAELGQGGSSHSVVSSGRRCATCHTAHAAAQPRLLRAEQRTLCLTCHDQPQQTRDGRTIPDMRPVLLNSKSLHGPVRTGECNACHAVHGSPNAGLLRKYFPAEFYQPFDPNNYALCMECHSKTVDLQAATSVRTAFRDGQRNLHYLHVNRPQKGRTCRACHEIHGSNLPRHMASGVPFGTGGWSMPIGFEQTTTGGRCSPGCHGPKEYRSTGPVPTSMPNDEER